MGQNFKTVEVAVATAVADAGTLSVNYPAGFDDGNFENVGGHILVVNGKTYLQPEDIGISFGDTSATITNRSGGDIPSGIGYVTFRLGGEKTQDLVARAATDETENGKLVSVNATRVEHLRVNLGSPKALDTDGILDGVAATDSAASYTSADFAATFDGTLDVARALTAVGTAGSNHVVTVTGTDEYGQPMKEALTLNGTTPVAGVKAFKTITQVDVAAGAAGDTFDMGWGNVLGLPVRIQLAADIMLERLNGAAASAGTDVVGLAKDTKSTATTADVRGTYVPASAPDGTKSYELVIISLDPTDIGNVQYNG